MELTNLAKDILLQAQMLRVEANTDKLCTEHILYGLLLAACYKEEPLNDPANRREAEALRAYMAGKITSIASARFQVREDALKNSDSFRDGSAVVVKATQAAGSKPVDALALARAVLEDPTPAVMLLMNFRHVKYAAEDAKYSAPQQIHNIPVSGKNDNKNDDGNQPGTSTVKAMIALALIAKMIDGQNETLHQNSVHVAAPPQHQQHRARRTKMGLFTYFGGTVAAAIQYFLFGLIIPAAILFGLEKWTGFVLAPSTPFLLFVRNAVFVLWAYYLARGVTILFGLASNSFGLFLNMLTDLALVGLLGCAVQNAWYHAAEQALIDPAGFPVWLKIVVSVIGLLILVFTAALYELLKSEGDVRKTKILLKNKEGTPAKIFFQSFTQALIWPYLYFAIVWIFDPVIPLWCIRAAEILGFIWVWSQVLTMWSCISLRNEKKRYKSGKGAKFFLAFHLYQFITEAVLFLHWIFAWFPMKTWVIIVLALYGLIGLLCSILFANN